MTTDTDKMMTRRVVHCKKASYDVYIGRGSKWGNPFTHLPSGSSGSLVAKDRESAIAAYRAWILEKPQLLAALPELRGKILGCYCAPLPCHGDVLQELVDALDEK